MTTTDTTARLLTAFQAFVEQVRTEYAGQAAEALKAARSGQYDQGRALVASFDEFAANAAKVTEGFSFTLDRAARLKANDAGSDFISALVPELSDLCAVLDESDPVTIERSHRALIEHLGEELFREMQAAGEV